MSGMVKKLPSQYNSGRIQSDHAAESVLGGERKHWEEDDGELGLRILRTDGAS